MLALRTTIALLLAFSAVTLAQDDGYESFPELPESRYKLYTIKLRWTEALAICQADGGGSHLVVSNSQEEADIVLAMFNRITDPDIKFLYVGIDDINVEGTWYTVLGGLVSVSGYDVWSAGEPNSSSGQEDCGSIKRDGKYNDETCSSELPFICEKPVVYRT